ncbi:MAG: XRE family transcriptional regulator [Pedobacter sp.]|nr:MAG: XRE family transcriptional regulator [Pedobacter sp.]
MEKEELLKKLGDNIRNIRTDKGISQKQLAYSIGKDQQSIQRLEVGKMNPTFFYLSQIAKGLDLQVKDLISNLEV